MVKKIAAALMIFACLFCAGCAKEAEPLPTETPAPAEPSPEAEEKLPEISGDWYGYWEIFSEDGAWAEMTNARWDCCAEIDAGNNMLLWDVDIAKETGLAQLELNYGEDEGGVSGGRFMDCETGFDKWSLDLNEDEHGLEMLLRGSYVSESNGDFSFVIRLRPWGDSWPEEDRPSGYAEFCRPLIDEGKPMPDSFK